MTNDDDIPVKEGDMKMAVAGVVAVISIASLAIIVTSQMGIEMTEGTTGLFMAAITGIVALAK